MPFLKSLRKLDWWTLAVELILIFVGITAALWFDNRREEGAERRLEQEILTELARGLTADTADLHTNLRLSASTRASVDTVLRHFDEGLPYRPVLAEHFGRATTVTNFIRNTAAYEQLKSAGLAIILDDSLRREIVHYYEFEGEVLHQSETIFLNRHLQDVLIPQMVEKFEHWAFLQSAVPHDYAALARDREFRTALTSQIGWLDWKDDNTAGVIALAERLISRIGEAR